MAQQAQAGSRKKHTYFSVNTVTIPPENGNMVEVAIQLEQMLYSLISNIIG
jgi:hypothetical protein